MLTHTLGFPRIGSRRELKKALEAYWKQELDLSQLLQVGRDLRRHHWLLQHQTGVDLLPVGDFSFYDHMLDLTAMLGAVPERFGWQGETVDPDTRFFMARGVCGQKTAPAMAMNKWFDSNYHYLVPEFWPGQQFRLATTDLFEQLSEIRQAGLAAKPVLVGPMTFLAMGRETDALFDRWEHLPAVLAVYEEILVRLSDRCDWIQLDEPILATELSGPARAHFHAAYRGLAAAAGPARLLVASYFGALGDNLDLTLSLPVAALHVDLVRAPEQLTPILERVPESLTLSLGLVDGRNVWRTDMDRALALARQAWAMVGPDRLMLAPSCSLLHVPVDLEHETELDEEIRPWLAFAVQKCRETALLGVALAGRGAAEALAESRAACAARQTSRRVRRTSVRQRLAALKPDMYQRSASAPERRRVQQERFRLPPLPTTTIGSFPQTAEIRALRQRYRQGRIGEQDYRAALRHVIGEVIACQEQLGLDVLVHGEAERTDMVEYFAEHLDGFCFTRNGWVQSYGSRCVKPPILFGDVERVRPMTVDWIRYAQSLTERPVKGMLTGPVTLLCWSFVRDDQPRAETCRQLALAVRDEVLDLERAGIGMIQIDEAALREGLPLRRSEWEQYLSWAVDAFRLATAVVRDETQIHSHMCYSEFNEIVPWIARMDADVISIEASRSGMELLRAFEEFAYPNDIGPGIWDIHSPRVPALPELIELLRRAARVVPPERLWVNPDCGLKTRAWPETLEALQNMVKAAGELRFFLEEK